MSAHIVPGRSALGLRRPIVRTLRRNECHRMSMSRSHSSPVVRPHVLVVEDDAGARRSLLLLLNGRGFDVAAYSTVPQALAAAAARPPDCLVADYRLHDEDGVDLRSEEH